ncbi:hypothetical protein J6590_088469 [Homalodisca vitripennis]|nr:hypothetical protein J6590_088469 [Homalodisca vitripennis]
MILRKKALYLIQVKDAKTRFRQSSPDAAAVTSELRLTALPRVERFPNLKSTPSNGMTTTTIDEKK